MQQTQFSKIAISTNLVHMLRSLKAHLYGAMHRPIDRPMHLICIRLIAQFVRFRLLPQAELTGNRSMTV